MWLGLSVPKNPSTPGETTWLRDGRAPGRPKEAFVKTPQNLKDLVENSLWKSSQNLEKKALWEGGTWCSLSHSEALSLFHAVSPFFLLLPAVSAGKFEATFSQQA